MSPQHASCMHHATPRHVNSNAMHHASESCVLDSVVATPQHLLALASETIWQSVHLHSMASYFYFFFFRFWALMLCIMHSIPEFTEDLFIWWQMIICWHIVHALKPVSLAQSFVLTLKTRAHHLCLPRMLLFCMSSHLGDMSFGTSWFPIRVHTLLPSVLDVSSVFYSLLELLNGSHGSYVYINMGCRSLHQALTWWWFRGWTLPWASATRFVHIAKAILDWLMMHFDAAEQNTMIWSCKMYSWCSCSNTLLNLLGLMADLLHVWGRCDSPCNRNVCSHARSKYASMHQYYFKQFSMHQHVPATNSLICLQDVSLMITSCNLVSLCQQLVLTSKLVPKGLESTTYALLAGFQNFGGVVSSQIGLYATQVRSHLHLLILFPG